MKSCSRFSLASLFFVFPLLVALFVMPLDAQASPGDVIASFDTPCNYPSGLASDGKNLYLADWRKSIIYKISPADGSTLNRFEAPTLKPHGMTFGQGKLYVSDDHTGYVYALNVKTGIVESTFQAPGRRATGLAFAGDVLYILERTSRKIYKVIPEDGTILFYFDVPSRNCESIAFDGSHLWVGNRIDDELYMVDPESGMVLGILDAPGPYTAGIEWLNGNLWNVDFQDRKIYRLKVKDEKMYRLTDTREARVEYLWALNNYGPGEVKDVVVNVALPEELPNQVLLSDVNFAAAPTKKVEDRWGQKCAVFKLGDIAAGGKVDVVFDVNVRVSAIRYLIIPEEVGTLSDIPRPIRRKYLAEGSRYRITSPYIQETAKRIVGNEVNPYLIARKIYNFIINNLHYEMIGGWDVPEVVLKRGSGSCSEYTFSFVSLCRAAGLPARYQGSIVVRGDDASIDEAFHRWAQVYLPGYGWIPVDANRGDSPSPVGQARGIGELANKFLITTQNGGGSKYLGWSYNSFATYKEDGFCRVEEDNFGFWEPLENSRNAPATLKARLSSQCSP